MRQKIYSTIARKLACSLAILGITVTGNVFAHATDHQKGEINRKKLLAEREQKKFWDMGKGWLLTSSGGLSYIHPDDDRYWFKLSGVMRFDEVVFSGNYRDKQSDFPSSGNIRRVETYFDGGVGKDWEYTLGLAFTGNQVRITDTWLAYSGFMENNQAFVGRVPGNWFGLDNANSTSWNPFLERSMIANAFYPGDGLGVMTDFWWDFGGFTVAVMQPDQNPSRDDRGSQSISNNNGSEVIPGARDRWRGTARLTLAPLHEEGNVWHMGVSGAYRELDSTVRGIAPQGNDAGVAFSVGPDAVGRNVTKLISTTAGNPILDPTTGNRAPIRANNVRMFNVEAARQYGSFMLEGEYTNVFVHRIGSHNSGTLTFDGWNVQTRYLLTGESHVYDVRDGQFGSVKPNGAYGAVELAARYDFINLNSKDVRGGTEHNVTFGVNWFVNQQIRLSANYIRASIHPALDRPKRNLDIIGMRLQVRFK